MSRDTTTEHSLMVARASLYSQQPLAVRGANTTLALLLLDRSGSMDEYGQTPRLAANECIQTIQRVPGAENAKLAIFTFASDVSLDIKPQPVRSVQLLKSYQADGSTKLYEAVFIALFLALEHYAIQEKEGRKTEVVISVITDGQDTASSPEYRLRMLQLVGQARKLNFKLQVIGIGVDSKQLAEDLGFQSKLAKTVAPTEQGVREAIRETSVIFSNTIFLNAER